MASAIRWLVSADHRPCFRRSKFSRMFRASTSTVPPPLGGGGPYTSYPRYVPWTGTRSTDLYAARSAVVIQRPASAISFTRSPANSPV